MKRIQNPLYLLTVLSLLVPVATQAQTRLNVKSKDGSQSSYLLAEIRKLTFATQNMIVTETSGISQAFALNDVGHLNFAEFTTRITAEEMRVKSPLILLPSPASDLLNIRYTATKSEMIQLRIVNMQGQIIFSQIHENRKGENTIQLNISHLPAGIYGISNGSESLSFLKSIK